MAANSKVTNSLYAVKDAALATPTKAAQTTPAAPATPTGNWTVTPVTTKGTGLAQTGAKNSTYQATMPTVPQTNADALLTQYQQQGTGLAQTGKQATGTGTLTQTGTATGSSGLPASYTSQAMNYLQNVLNSGAGAEWNGYPMSQTVLDAQDYLSSVMGSRPGAFRSKYADQIAQLYDQIMNREKFTYDVNKDPLFQQYKTQYMTQGQRAMQDAMGQAAALAGGYGSSWGNSAGYQAYQNYLQMLNDRIPELEQRAFDRYAYEGQEMRNNMDMNVNLDNIDYGRYRDTVQDWKDDRLFSYGMYRDAVGDWQTDRAFDYGAYRDQVGDWQADRAFGLDYYGSEADRQASNYWNQMNYNLDMMNYNLNYQKFLADAAANGGGYSVPQPAYAPVLQSAPDTKQQKPGGNGEGKKTVKPVYGMNALNKRKEG